MGSDSSLVLKFWDEYLFHIKYCYIYTKNVHLINNNRFVHEDLLKFQ